MGSIWTIRLPEPGCWAICSRREGHVIGRRHVSTLMTPWASRWCSASLTPASASGASGVPLPTTQRWRSLGRSMSGRLISPPFQCHAASHACVRSWLGPVTGCWRGGCPTYCRPISALRQSTVTTYGVPNIFNTDPRCQFTSLEFTGILKAHGIQISMDGEGC